MTSAVPQSATWSPEAHLGLDQSMLKLPYEFLRKIFKSSQRHIEREKDSLLAAMAMVTATLVNHLGSKEEHVQQILSMQLRFQGLKRKLEMLRDEEKYHQEHSRQRIAHIQELFEMSGTGSELYDRWSRTRLDRLLVDFMLRSGYCKSAQKLAAEKGIEGLVDVESFLHSSRIEISLRQRSTVECLAWCTENRAALKKQKNNLEFDLRLQQYIELIRSRRHAESITHAKKFIAPHHEGHLEDIKTAAALLAFSPGTCISRYQALYDENRWDYIAEQFVSTHHSLFNLPPRPLLHMALSAGLSALKTPSCHSGIRSPSSSTASSNNSLCPICSIELNELARPLPYAHHLKSLVDLDTVVLPNGRVYGRKKLELISAKLGLPDGHLKDPTTGEAFLRSNLRKVFIS